jgi:hypothetical protein
MAHRERPGDRSGGPSFIERVMSMRRAGARRDEVAAETRATEEITEIEELRRRVDDLEAALEGLQDAVHRENVRQDERIDALAKSTQPEALSRALSADARRRGL